MLEYFTASAEYFRTLQKYEQMANSASPLSVFFMTYAEILLPVSKMDAGFARFMGFQVSFMLKCENEMLKNLIIFKKWGLA